MAEIIFHLSVYRQVSGGWTRRAKAGGWASRRRHHWHHYRCSPIERFGAADGPKAAEKEEALAEMIAAQKRRPLYLGGCPPPRLLPNGCCHGCGRTLKAAWTESGRPRGRREGGGGPTANRWLPPLVSAFKTAVDCDGALSVSSEMDSRGGGRGAAPGKDAVKRFGDADERATWLRARL
ncbi:hypothetical protein MTO96_035520 [Rhipicephalus appendiculatus]